MSCLAFSATPDEPVLLPVARMTAELLSVERLLRSSYAAAGRLATAAAEAQASERLSLTAGHQILAAIAGTQVAVSEAIGRISTGHRQLERLARQLGRDDDAGYGEVKPPKTAQIGVVEDA